MAEKKEAAMPETKIVKERAVMEQMESIEFLKENNGIRDSVFEGVKSANAWKTGKQVTESEFQRACDSFQKAPVDGNRTNKGVIG